MESPYPIYFNKRQIRAVFIVNVKDFTQEVFKNIFDTCVGHYGGRFCPIVFSNGKDLSKEAWEFIKDFDPDVVNILFKPGKNLMQKIENRLSPYVVCAGDAKQHIGFPDQLPMLSWPTPDLISKATAYYMHKEKPLVLFNTKDLATASLNQFIHFNFGTYEHYDLDHIGEKIEEKKLFVLDTAESVNDALIELGHINKRFVFPVQLSAISNEIRDVAYNPDNQNFTVIVGDSPYDLLHYWNKSIMIPQWLRPEICQMWLPTEVAEDERLKEGLQQFFQQRAARTGDNNGTKFLQFVSFSLKEERLKKIAEKLGEKAWCGKKVSVFKPKELFPNYGENKDYFSLKQGMSLHQAYGNEETVIIEEPALPSGVQGGHWMLDVYIQYRPEKYAYTNLRHWWRLPNRNHLSRMFFQHTKARIQKNGIPSVVMEAKSSFRPDESKLEIKIPEDKDILASLISGQNMPVYNSDPRSTVIDRKTYFHTQRSDKGRYLQGIIGLFGELGQAYYNFRDPFWKRMFENLSLSDPLSDDAKKGAIFNKLKKTLNVLPKGKEERESEIDWLAEFILRTSKEYGKAGKEANFDFFVKEKIKLVQEFLKAQGDSPVLGKKKELEYKDEVYREIKDLVEGNVLLMGIKPHCPSCGYANWLHVDDIKQKTECTGCGNIFDLKPEIPWLYKLNSLIESGVRYHGLVPVLMTLGELQDEARSSFIYSPSLDLYKKFRKKYKQLGDLDILCIQDGQFIVGEIKQSSSLFKEIHFKDSLKIAQQIKPNILLFSSFDGKKTKVIEEGIKFLKQELEPLEIDVIWYEARKIGYHY
ncbi:MAG: hypothetical protein RL641_328 [Candidatus Parcubacteria bacterium]|jgi:hypothetical protein